MRSLSLCLFLALGACNPDLRGRFAGHADSLRIDDERANNLLRTMSLEEKIGQLTLYTSDMDATGPTVRPEYKIEISSGRVGAIFNAYTAAFTRELQELAVEGSPHRIPLLFGYDVIHGFKTVFPIPLGETASWDLDALSGSARIAATEAAAAGLHWTFAPMVDVARDPRWGRIAEGAGEDTWLGSQVAAARVRGFQGAALGDDDAVLACAKHFAAYGAAEAGRDYNTVDISERTLREVYLPPFRAAADAGVATFMTSFNEISGVPSTANHYLLTDILKGEWQFSGFVVSDFTSVNELVPHGIAADLAEAGEKALEAGLDMDMQGAVFKSELPALIASGRVAESAVDEAARRVLSMKFKLGLMDDPYKFSDPRREAARILTADNLAAARATARKSIVLLKNEGSLLPLSKTIKSIALIGPLGDDKRELLGSWSAAGDARDVVSLAEGLRAAASPATQINVVKGAAIDDADDSGFAAAIQAAAAADVVIAAMGESAQMSGEAASRAHLGLPGRQLELLQKLQATGKPIVLVLMNGRPLVLNWEQDHIPALVETWFLGTQAGHAIADVLFGDYNPSGRLPVSFPRAEGQVPVYYNAKNTGRPFSATDKYTSKYLDLPNTPLYPFGFGLSYTPMAYSGLTLSRAVLEPSDTELTVSVTLTNNGQRAGLETVQLYVTDLVGSVTRPVKELRGFQQVLLQAGETRTVSLPLRRHDLAFYDINMHWVVEPGRFKVHVGANSNSLLTQDLEVR